MMFWCESCGCAYPHGPEGPASALRKHTAGTHGGPDEGSVRPVTGRQIVIGFMVLAVAAWIAKAIGYPLV